MYVTARYGIAQLLYISMAMVFSACSEATLDGGVIGASLLQQQSHTQKTVLVASVKSESSALSRITASGDDSSGQETWPSLSLLQSFSAGSGMASFAQETGASANAVEQPSASLLQTGSDSSGSLLQTGSGYQSESALQTKPPRTQQTVLMSLLHGQERGSLRSRLFWLAPMWASLIACCIILLLVYIVTSGEAEDEQLSRMLGRIREKQANKGTLNVAAFSGSPPITASRGIASMGAADRASPSPRTQSEVPEQVATDDSVEKEEEEQLARDEPARKEASEAAAAEVKSDAAAAQSEAAEGDSEVESEAGESDASSDADTTGESDLR